MKKVFLLFTSIFLIGCSLANEPNSAATLHNISDNITVGFTKPNLSSSNNPVTDKIVNLINNQSSDCYLDVCIYGFDEENIISVLESAVRRGVHVRMVCNADGNKPLSDKSGSYYDGYYRIADALDKTFPKSTQRTKASCRSRFNDFVLYKSGSGIMHNKFMIFTDKAGKQTLCVGSGNYTHSCLNLNYNDFLFITDSKICQKYERQFEYLLGLRATGEESQSFNIDNTKITVSFSRPKRQSTYIISQIIDEVDNAESNIRFMVYSYTHEDLCNAMINKNLYGISVVGIYDSSQLRYSKEELLIDQDIECSVDGNECIVDSHGGKLHNKCMIIDENLVITGSFNWSKNADRQNQENILFIYSEEIAKLYLQYWNYVKKQAK